MNRAFNLALTREEVVKHCEDKKISISVIESLPEGGVRLVCSSSGGAEKVQSKLGKHLIKGDVRRIIDRTGRNLW
jgi:hypothetical protein